MSIQQILSQESLQHFCIGDFAYTEKLIPTTLDAYEKWVAEGFHGPLKYLSDDRKDIRGDLRKYFPEVQSALVFLFPYSKNIKDDRLAAFISGFKGKDYHHVLEKRLMNLGEDLKKILPNLCYKISVDRHPVLERDLAYRAGLGWFGKSSMLIHPKLGTFFMIGALLLSEKLDLPIKPVQGEYCGACQRCMDSCPTKAIVAPKKLDAKKCISCFTLEIFKEVEAPEGYKTQNYILGCDCCQEVCPWNKKHLEVHDNEGVMEIFFSRPLNEIQSDIEAMSKKGYLHFFKEMSLERLGKQGILKNLKK